MDEKWISELEALHKIVNTIESLNDSKESFKTLNNKIEEINSLIFRMDKSLKDKELKNQVHDRIAVMILAITVTYLNSNQYLPSELKDSFKLLEKAHKIVAADDIRNQIKENIDRIKPQVKKNKKNEKKDASFSELMEIITKIQAASSNSMNAMSILRSEFNKIEKLVKKINKGSNKDSQSQINEMVATVILNTAISYLNSLQNTIKSPTKTSMEEALGFLITAYRIAGSNSIHYDIRNNIKILVEQILYLDGVSPVKIQIRTEKFMKELDNPSFNVVGFLVNGIYILPIIIGAIGSFTYSYITNSWNNDQIFMYFWVITIVGIFLIAIISWIWNKIEEENESMRRTFGWR